MNNINSQDISVVVQGPIVGSSNDPYESQLTYHCLKSICKYLPNAEIILSTWKDSDIKDLEYDILVENNDPGAIFLSGSSKPSNLNRLIVSTQRGLACSSRPYVLKLRTDMHLINGNFINIYAELNKYYSERSLELLLFRNRVLISTLYCRNPAKSSYLFHISDIFMFGNRSDITDLWNIPLAKSNEISKFMMSQGFLDIRVKFCKSANFIWSLTPEQYIWLSFLKEKDHEIRLDYRCDGSPKKVFDSELSIINNFIVVEPDFLGVQLPKRMFSNNEPWSGYTLHEWKKLYSIYCTKEKHEWQKLLICKKYYQWLIAREKLFIERRVYKGMLNLFLIKPIKEYLKCNYPTLYYFFKEAKFNKYNQ